MTLWLLRPRGNLGEYNPWEPWFDKAFGFVVRADTELQARKIAHMYAGDEVGLRRTGLAWMSPRYSTCEPLEHDGPQGMVIKDFHSA